MEGTNYEIHEDVSDYDDIGLSRGYEMGGVSIFLVITCISVRWLTSSLLVPHLPQPTSKRSSSSSS